MYFITFDLKSGYHHVDIHPDYWSYLGFSWGTHVARKFYVFKVLPFGLSSACYVFTKLLRPLVKRWRGMGIKAIVYIDDGACAAANRHKCIEHRDIVVSDLKQAGFVLSIPKCNLDPMQTRKWLGFIIDLIEGNFHVPDDKLDNLKANITKAFLQRKVQVRMLASIVGKVISMGLALGPITRLRTRAFVLCYQ